LLTSISDRRGALIACGGASAVIKRVDPSSGREIAVKQVRVDGYDQEVFFREIEALNALIHPCIVKMFGWYPLTESGAAEIHTEYAENGSLDSVLEQSARGSPPEFWTKTGQAIIIAGIVLGMRYVHSRGIVHYDLKPSNILLNAKGHAMICDFGTSRWERSDCTPTQPAATIKYAAPELFDEKEICTAKADVFSFGSVLFEILTGSPVFAASEYRIPVMKRLFAGDLPTLPGEYGEMMQNLIARCWLKPAQDRPSFQAILNVLVGHPDQIVRGADPWRVTAFIEEVSAWESQTTPHTGQ
jgi:serine/threonine protein kinase